MLMLMLMCARATMNPTIDKSTNVCAKADAAGFA
jgi:hypothetical protein